MRNGTDNLSEMIKKLIASRREDDWWDFKRNHHHDKASLVHDILCMANNRPRRDSYIIFGIDDSDFSVKGVEDDENRRNQQMITDILRHISFAGGTRPRIEMYTIEIEKHDVDILVVKDSNDLPYYLEKDYYDSKIRESSRNKRKCVRAYHIYTRVVDNNTPIDKQADYCDIELLWRRRLGVDLPILERFKILLDEVDKWNFDWGNKKTCYHSDYPEFQIVQAEKMRESWFPSAAFYINPKMYSAKLNFMYHNTVIYETVLLSYDEMRKYLPEFKNEVVKCQSDFWYSYYQLDTIEGKLLKIFTHGNCSISSREPNFNQILIFKDEEDRRNFNSYLNNHFHDYSDDEIKCKYKHQIDIDKKYGGCLYDAFQVGKVGCLYDDWRNNEQFREI